MSEKSFTRALRVSGASFVVIACAVSLVLVGCSREEASAPSPDKPRAAVQPAEPANAHMRDPKLKAQLREQVDDMKVLEQARYEIVAKMEALVTEKYKGDMKAAADDPEMKTLIRRAHAIESNISSNRAHSAEMIRARAQKSLSQKEVSK